jgi:hypothetical protein
VGKYTTNFIKYFLNLGLYTLCTWCILICLVCMVVYCLVYIVEVDSCIVVVLLYYGCIVVILCVLIVLCAYCCCYLNAGLLARSQYSEGPATGHLDTGFSWFPCVYKQMLRWFPRYQVATTCFSRSPPDLNVHLLVTSFVYLYIYVK